jgi:hypothetical protein
MRLSGDAARQYIQGGGSYQVVGGAPQEAPQQSGGISGLLGNILSAPIGLGKGAIEGTRYALSSLGAKSGPVDFKPITMSEEEWNAFRRGDPLGSTLKNMAGTAAIFGGAGAGFKGGILPGAAGGFSTADLSDPVDIITKTATGGALGGAIGLGAAGLSKGIGKLATPKVAGEAVEGVTSGVFQKGGAFVRKGAQGMEKNALKRIIGGGTPTKQLGGAQMLEDTIRLSDEYKIPINNADDALTLSAKMFDDYGTVVRDKIAGGIPGQPDVQIMRSMLNKSMNKALGGPGSSDQKAVIAVKEELENWLQRKGNTWDSLYSFKQQIGPKGKWSVRQDVPVKAKAYEDLYTEINKQLEKAIGPEFREANRMVERSIQLQQYAKQGQLRDIPAGFWTDPMQDLAMAGAFVGGAPGAAAGAAVNKLMMGPKGQRLLAKGAGKVADVLEKGPGAIKGPNVSKLLGSKVMQATGQQLGKTIPYLPGIGTMGAMQGGIGSQGGLPIPQLPGTSPELGITSMGGGADPRMLAAQYMGQGMSLDDAIKAAEFFGGGGQEQKKMTESQLKANAAVSQMAEARQLLEGGQVGQGKVQNIQSKLQGLTGLGGGGVQDEYRAKLAGARSMAISLLSGANVPPSEYERLAGMIPEDTDNKARALSKMNEFINTMQQFTEGQGMAPQPLLGIQ